jgi:hypothetical protein
LQNFGFCGVFLTKLRVFLLGLTLYFLIIYFTKFHSYQNNINVTHGFQFHIGRLDVGVSNLTISLL